MLKTKVASSSVVPDTTSRAVARAVRSAALAAAMGWRAPQCGQKTSSDEMDLPQKPQKTRSTASVLIVCCDCAPRTTP